MSHLQMLNKELMIKKFIRPPAWQQTECWALFVEANEAAKTVLSKDKERPVLVIF